MQWLTKEETKRWIIQSLVNTLPKIWCHLLHTTLVSQDKLYQHPPRDAICHIESNIRIEQNIYFVDVDLIPTRGWLLVALGILVLVHLFEKGLNQPGTDECYQMAQHSSTMGSINMQQHQLQGSSQQTKDNNTDIFCNISHEMPLCGV